MPRRIIIAIATINPFEVFLLLLCCMSGILGLFSPNSTNSRVVVYISHWELVIWYAVLAVGGTVALVGACGRTASFLYIERTGLILITGFSFGFAILLAVSLPKSITILSLMYVFFALTGLIRLYQIHNELLRVVRSGSQL